MDNAHDNSRSLIAIHGEDAAHFLQGILTQDITKLAQQQIQFAALLSPQGKILHDMFVISGPAIGHNAPILLDTPTVHTPVLLKRLAMYKLRARVEISNLSADWHIYYSLSEGLADPRHSDLPKRNYILTTPPADADDGMLVTYHKTRIALGIPDSSIDFAPDSIVAMDAGYDLLNAISFTKGCYVGQEVTARMHYKHIARKGFYVLEHATIPPHLALLKFDAVEAENGTATLNGITYDVRLPAWMQPKYDQFKATNA